MSSFIVVFPAYCEEFVALSKGATKHVCWEVKILPWAGFKPLLKKTWAHLPVALVPSIIYLFEQERCSLFGNRVFSRHQSSIKALSLVIKVRHWTEWEINHKWQVKHLSARWAFLHTEKENFSASLHKRKHWVYFWVTPYPTFLCCVKGMVYDHSIAKWCKLQSGIKCPHTVLQQWNRATISWSTGNSSFQCLATWFG